MVYLELARADAERRLEERRGQHAIVRDFARILDGQYRDLEPPDGRAHRLRRSSARKRSSSKRARYLTRA